ncbi:pentatricopeptide repeat-containing protein At3g09040, mitochondrial-like [Syzygium oleosum]|uniref:pentatricopeptide repeat-containing protein At3g09040, mitochondrial-like n=1 Tax=Syzygium oleosum TaxID=219896 RepID=UPI0011D214C0|nr:pentatricopeptide repeat-containing protein At3g09040, mitochondrial-like [Syzygium oleosum]XP_056169137.1 pentatricopeptide repeat-containing protein At3g09040, mitochondrial-like [Syzygium oleosum]XP_056169138.1 pentatricopeptide repeat-containing protein At3g09040, mitochondrial-like [Syzygium oleosum]
MRIPPLPSTLKPSLSIEAARKLRPTFARDHQNLAFRLGSSDFGHASLQRQRRVAALAKLLSISAESQALAVGAQAHCGAVKLGFRDDVFVQNHLINVYSRCGALGDGLKVFGEMPQRNVVSWTSLISGAVRNGELDVGFRVFLSLMRSGLRPNEFSIGSVLKACAITEACELGLCVHGIAVKLGMEKDSFFGSSMLSLYSKLGCVEEAEQIFNYMENCDVGCWNAMIGGYVLCGCGIEAMRLASSMRTKGVIMDEFTFINALKGCILLGNLYYGKQLHGLIMCSDVQFSIPVMNSLIDMYLKHSQEKYAFDVFDRMQKKDVISWNTVIGAFHEERDVTKVAGLFHKFMLAGLKPTEVTFSVLFRQCGNACDLNMGLQLCCLAVHFGHFHHSNVTSSLINMFAKCNALLMACSVFDSILSKGTGDFNELISGYNLCCCYPEALQVFCNLLSSGVETNVSTFASILETCVKSGYEKMGRQIHGVIIKRALSGNNHICCSLAKFYVRFGCPDIAFLCFDALEKLDLTCWSIMISTFNGSGFHSEAIRSLNFVLEADGKPDEFIFGSIFNSCADSSSFDRAKSVHSLATKTGYDRHVYVASSIIDAYAKCGDIASARLAFNQSSGSDDVVIFNSMIMAYAHHGLITEALELFHKMKLANLCPSQATFISVISACGHMGCVDQGCALFESMKSDYGLEPSPGVFGCLVDMLSRNGYLEGAKGLIKTMPFSPWPGIWRSFLSGCRIHGNRELGEWASQMLCQLVPENDAAHVLLFKVYSEAGSWENAEHLRQNMIHKGISKSPGYSWIQVH